MSMWEDYRDDALAEAAVREIESRSTKKDRKKDAKKMTLTTRRPTGIPTWPMALVAGPEKMRKSQIAILETPDGRMDLPLRVINKIDWSGNCWVWIGANTGGEHPYGVTWDGTRRVKAHRFSYEASGRTIPDGLVIDHLCRNTRCVRPSHLEPVTAAENILRGTAPGPRAINTNLCKRGHEYTPENTFVRGDGYRECRECMRMRSRAKKARKRALKLKGESL